MVTWAQTMDGRVIILCKWYIFVLNSETPILITSLKKYFLSSLFNRAGGAVKGNKVIGKFPSDMWSLSGSRPQPTFPWESLWNGIGKWAGVEDMTQVCPNLSVFEGTSLLFDSAEMFN